MAKIVIVEDHQETIDLIQHLLGAHHVVLSTDNEADLNNILTQNPIDLIILDIGLPESNGFKICSNLKNNQIFETIPIVFLSAHDQQDDVIMAYNLGADDFISKPINPAIFKAKVNSKLDNISKSAKAGSQFLIGDLIIDLGEVSVYDSGDGKKSVIELTQKEFKILSYFARNQGEVVNRTDLINVLSQSDTPPSERAVDLHVSAIRKKLGRLGSYIKTIYGGGYKLSIEHDAESD